jgi:translation initiation factor 2 subunit 2
MSKHSPVGCSNMAEETYKKLLDRAISQLPPEVSKKARFIIPKPASTIMGNRTILYNLKEICDTLRRSREHVLKYLSKELATAGNIDGTNILFQGKFENVVIRRLIERYAQEFVYCPICHQPDTRMVKEGRYNFLICDACGAKSSAKRGP